jgi:hypothetical protein
VFLTPERLPVGKWLPVVQLACTFAIAILSYRYLERPIRARGLPFGRPAYMVPAAVALSLFLVVRATYARAMPAAPLLNNVVDAIANAAMADTATFRIMVVGDSTANSLGWALRGLRTPGLAVELKGRDGCTMLYDTCFGPSWGQFQNELRPNATLVFAGGAFMHGMTANGQWQNACKPDWHAKFEDVLATRLRGLNPAENGVWAVTLPYPLGPWESAKHHAEVDCINASIRKVAPTIAGVRVLDLAERICRNGACELERNGVKIRPDGVHFDIDGALDVSRWVLDQVKR